MPKFIQLVSRDARTGAQVRLKQNFVPGHQAMNQGVEVFLCVFLLNTGTTATDLDHDDRVQGIVEEHWTEIQSPKFWSPLRYLTTT